MPFKKEWIADYENKGIDMTSINKNYYFEQFAIKNSEILRWQSVYWWDIEILEWFKNLGPRKFNKLDIWDKDWDRLGKSVYDQNINFKRHASWLTKLIIRYIRLTPNYRDNIFIRWLDNILRVIF